MVKIEGRLFVEAVAGERTYFDPKPTPQLGVLPMFHRLVANAIKAVEVDGVPRRVGIELVKGR